MAKQAAIISFTSLANQTSFINGVNANFAALNAALLNTHSLDGSTPNSMTANLDMNSNRILNLPTPSFPTDALRLQDIGSTATINLIANSIAVSSFFNPILQLTTASAVRSAFGVQSYISDFGAQAGSQFFPLTPNINTSLVRSANTSQIQAAIDYAYNNGLQTIRLPAGTIYCANGIYLDAPGNLRIAGQVQFTGNPVANNILIIFGTTITFVASGATGNQVNIGGNLAATLANLLSFLQGSSDVNLTKFTYTVAGNNLNVTAISLTPTVLGTTVAGTTILGASNPTIFSFSLHLAGAGGLSNHNTSGTLLYFQDNTQPALILGPGQGMMVSYLSLISNITPTSRAALPIMGTGIAYGGHSRCMFEGVGVENWRRGYYLGFNGYNILGDSNTMFKCTAFGNYIGHHISLNQNYINSLINCDFGGNTTHIQSDVAKAVNIYGGNFSSAAFHNAFTISGVSSLTYITDNTQTGYFSQDNASFTCTISSPDQAFKDGAYDAFVINTVAFGAIPLLLTSFNQGTNVATFKFYQGWLLGSGMQTSLLNGGALATTFNTALSTATTLYACETITPFNGFCFNVDGLHIENPDTYTRFLYHNSGFGGDFAHRFNRITFNWGINDVSDHGGLASFEAIFQCQQAHPFINMIGGSTSGTVELTNISNVSGGVNTVDRVNFDVFQASTTLQKRVIVKNCDIRFNLRCPASAIDSGILGTSNGFGEWDASPFMAGTDVWYTQPNQFGHVPYYGYFPAPWAIPSVDLSTLQTWQGTLPGLGTYPPMMGRTPYKIYYPSAQTVIASTNNASRWVESNHTNWSWGQNITVNWSYVAGSNVVVLNDFRFMFAGLRLLINNGGGNEFYTCTGVYPTLGYITVVKFRPGTGTHDLAGTAGTTYSGASISQEPFSFSYTGTLPYTQSVTNTSAGATTAAVGDLTGAQIVNLKLTAVGANNYTTRTATQMFGDISGAYVGLTYEARIENTNAGTTTLVAGSGVTLTGTMTIAQNTTRVFTVTFPTATTCTIESRGLLTSV